MCIRDRSGAPHVLPLRELLKQWLAFRGEVVTQRLQWRLGQIDERLEVLDGFLTVYLNIDEVIRIVRNEDDPQAHLMKRFKLSEAQAHAVLELKLRRLAKLEQIKIEGEHESLTAEKKQTELILGSKARLKTLLKKELKEDVKAYGDERRTAVNTGSAQAAAALDLDALTTAEPVTVIVSREGWVRAAKGHDLSLIHI